MHVEKRKVAIAVGYDRWPRLEVLVCPALSDAIGVRIGRDNRGRRRSRWDRNLDPVRLVLLHNGRLLWGSPDRDEGRNLGLQSVEEAFGAIRAIEASLVAAVVRMTPEQIERREHMPHKAAGIEVFRAIRADLQRMRR